MTLNIQQTDPRVDYEKKPPILAAAPSSSHRRLSSTSLHTSHCTNPWLATATSSALTSLNTFSTFCRSNNPLSPTLFSARERVSPSTNPSSGAWVRQDRGLAILGLGSRAQCKPTVGLASPRWFGSLALEPEPAPHSHGMCGHYEQ
ncbi:hypothetical protein CRG98_010530 [Punica granatum]|uniref:Uncharacterized protein n=1 Tax=Punica granatum TaxID=22663 RepID=A0A2I0KKN5_PUNGR|nr:hypothetical protein CRG98_010530 [Punica granatum]